MKEPIEIADIRKGDLIRFEPKPPVDFIASAIEYVASYDKAAWRDSEDVPSQHYLLDRPTPPVELPTEPGWYVDRYECVWQMHDDGEWTRLGNAEWVPESCVPFTRLEPVPITAERVIARVRTIFGGPGALLNRDVDAIAREFGVTNV